MEVAQVESDDTKGKRVYTGKKSIFVCSLFFKTANIQVPFSPKPTIAARADLCPLYCLRRNLFYNQGQLWHLICAGDRDLSNQIRMGTIQSNRQKKNAKRHNYVSLKRKFQWKSHSTFHPHLLPPNPSILKAVPPKWTLGYLPFIWEIPAGRGKREGERRKIKR